MSIPSGNKPSDQSKYRETYMNELKLQESNLQATRDAKKMLAETGAPPQQRDDTRTVEEKRRDVGRLRVEVLGEVRSITDGKNAQIIVSDLKPDELFFVMNNIPVILPDIRSKFKQGVPALAFLTYVRALMKQASESSGIAYGLQSGGARNYVMSNAVISQKLASKSSLDQLEASINQLPASDLTRNIKDLIEQMKNQIPDSQALLALGTLPEGQLSQLSRLLSDVVENVPSKEQISLLIARLDSGEGDRATLNRIEELFTLTKQDMEDAEDLRAFIEETSYNPSSSGAEQTEGEAEVAAATFDPVLGISDFEALTLGQKRAFLIQKKLSGELMTTYSRTALSKLGSRTNTEPLMETFTDYLAQQSGTGAVMAMPVGMEAQEAVRIEGSGMVRKNKRPEVKQLVDFERGIPAQKPFIVLGSKLINRKRLNDGVLQIRHPSLNHIMGMPSKKISRELTGVFKTILGGGVPDFNSLTKLSSDEQRTLRSVAERTQIDDRLSLPTPDKDNEDREINRFLILKGQIESGNNNPSLIKEFKVLLMKMMKEKKIPKREAMEVLEFIISLGF